MVTSNSRVTLVTLAKFLVGRSSAIRILASRSDTLWLGLVFVFSAAFAREYDGEDLMHEPGYLLIPWGASLGSSFLLFLLIEFVARCRGFRSSSFLSRYRVFLSMYWMTAPLAWVYAIPVERFLSASAAVEANLWLLGFVALWRVVLITQVAKVLYVNETNQFGAVGFFFVVMLFADTLALWLISFVNVPILVIMGGVHLTDSELVMRSAKLTVALGGVVTWPIWLFGTLSIIFGKSTNWTWGVEQAVSSPPISMEVKLFAAASLIIWAVILPFTQPEQQLRHAVEQDLRSDDFRHALATMSARQQTDFPPHWDPPPHIRIREQRLQILKIVSALAGNEAPWVRAIFIRKLSDALGSSFPMETVWVDTDPIEILDLLKRIPEGPDLLKDRLSLLEHFNYYSGASEEAKQRVEAAGLELTQPFPEATSREWPEERIQIWRDFLKPLEARDNRTVVLLAFEANFKKLLDENETVPEEIQERIRALLAVEKP